MGVCGALLQSRRSGFVGENENVDRRGVNVERRNGEYGKDAGNINAFKCRRSDANNGVVKPLWI